MEDKMPSIKKTTSPDAAAASSSPAPAAEAPRKGKVYTFVKTSRGLFPIAELRKAEMKEQRAASKQFQGERIYMTEKNLVPLPFAVQGLLVLMDNCSFFDACVRQIAKDVVGQGWFLTLKEDQKEADQERKDIEEFLEDPNTEEDSITDVLERCIIDWGAIGWLTMEVCRDESSHKVNGLYHVPAHTIRVHKDKNKFCQMRQTERRWFKRFGYEKEVNVNTGEESDKIEEKDRAHEMIYYRNYYPQSAWYGSPLILSAIGAVKALIGIRDYNLAFFENYGVPAAIVTVTGCWDEDDVKQISDFIDVEIKGSSNAHKTCVLNPPEGGSVKWEPLIVEIKEGHFKLYFKQLRDEVLVCYKMPPYRIGIAEVGALGGTTSPESTHIYIDSVVEPLKIMLQHIMTRKIIGDGFKCERYAFDLGELDIRDETAEIDNCIRLFYIGALSVNEILEYLGWTTLDVEKFPWAEEHFMRNDIVPAGTESMAQRDTAIADLKSDVDRVIRAVSKEMATRRPVIREIHRARRK
jgi:PBSX family phage portal protein